MSKTRKGEENRGILPVDNSVEKKREKSGKSRVKDINRKLSTFEQKNVDKENSAGA